MLSLRTALRDAGIEGDGNRISMRQHLHVHVAEPRLRRVIRALHDPQLAHWVKHERVYADKEWTIACQGVATEGSHWYFTTNRQPIPSPFGRPSGRDAGVVKIDPETSDVVAEVLIPRSVAGHVGAVAIFRDLVYVALEHPHQIAIFDLALRPFGDPIPITTHDDHFAWCAINPWNGLLYTSQWENASELFAYDPATGQRINGRDVQLSSAVNKVQGGTFSPNGKIYLASDAKGAATGIHVFSQATGAFFGVLRVEVHHGLKQEEMEGVSYVTTDLMGPTTHLHAVVLDQRDFDGTGPDIFLKSYTAPDPTVA